MQHKRQVTRFGSIESILTRSALAAFLVFLQSLTSLFDGGCQPLANHFPGLLGLILNFGPFHLVRLAGRLDLMCVEKSTLPQGRLALRSAEGQLERVLA